ncbi:pectate lyase superfamily protein domain-containing protein [Penicillium canescens]|nr:pectate lyase superfamily protein domain-containing protein [Penicillium canescens]
MDHGHENKEVEEDDNNQYDSTLGPCEEQVRLRHFYPSRQKLLFVLEILRSYQAMLHGDNSFARFFNVPLMSDVLAERIVSLFSEARPKILEACNHDINWADVVRERLFEVKRHENGKYQYYLPKRKALVEMSEFDHCLILSGIPRQLVHPKSHSSDVQAERSTLELIAKEIASWNDILSNLNEINKDILGKVAGKLRKLGESHSTPCSSQASQPIPTYESNEVNPHARTASEASAEASGAAIQSKFGNNKLFPYGRRWTAEQKACLPRWFESRAHLPEKEIELEFKQDFGHSRTFAAIQAKLYEVGAGKLRRKRKEEHRQNKIPVEISPAPAIDPFRSSIPSRSTPEAEVFDLPLPVPFDPEVNNNVVDNKGYFNVKDFGAVGDGKQSDTKYIERALAAANTQGGGVVWFPPGLYLIDQGSTVGRGFTISDSITLAGTGTGKPQFDAEQEIDPFATNGSKLLIRNTDIIPIFVTGWGSVIRDLAIYHEQEKLSTVPWVPTIFKEAIHVFGHDVLLKNLYLRNPYVGVVSEGVGRLSIDRLFGQPLDTGIDIDRATDTVRISNVHFWRFWSAAEPVAKHTFNNANAIISRRNDNPHFSNIFAIGYKTGFVFRKSVYGITSKFRINNADIDNCKFGIVIEADAQRTTGQAVNYTFQGTDDESQSGIRIEAPDATVQCGNIRVQNVQTNGILVLGPASFLMIDNVWVESWDKSGKEFPAIEAAGEGAVVNNNWPEAALWW